jgi:predicted amidohydrolase YtcJ
MKEFYTAEELAALFKEIREDEAAAKREDAHCYGTEAFKNILDAKEQAPAAEKTKDKGIER